MEHLSGTDDVGASGAGGTGAGGSDAAEPARDSAAPGSGVNASGGQAEGADPGTADGSTALLPSPETPEALPAVVRPRVPATGEPRVDAALQLLDRLPGLPVSEHAGIFEQVHAQLSDVLGELDPQSAGATDPARG